MKIYSAFAFLILISLSSCKTRPGSSAQKSRGAAPEVEHEFLGAKPKKGPAKEDPAPEANDEALPELESFVREWEGTPHRMGGMSNKGVDCSGFVILACREVFQHQFSGRRAEDLFGELEAIEKTTLRSGDLIFFKIGGPRINHVGIYLGNGRFAHASSSRGVMISSLNENYWQQHYFRAGRLN